MIPEKQINKSKRGSTKIALPPPLSGFFINV
jgi:hypothetical protein